MLNSSVTTTYLVEAADAAAWQTFLQMPDDRQRTSRFVAALVKRQMR
jgi:hypothetical protein